MISYALFNIITKITQYVNGKSLPINNINVGLQYICYTVAYPEQEGEEGKTDGNQTRRRERKGSRKPNRKPPPRGRRGIAKKGGEFCSI